MVQERKDVYCTIIYLHNFIDSILIQFNNFYTVKYTIKYKLLLYVVEITCIIKKIMITTFEQSIIISQSSNDCCSRFVSILFLLCTNSLCIYQFNNFCFIISRRLQNNDTVMNEEYEDISRS